MILVSILVSIHKKQLEKSFLLVQKVFVLEQAGINYSH